MSREGTTTLSWLARHHPEEAFRALQVVRAYAALGKPNKVNDIADSDLLAAVQALRAAHKDK